MDTSDRHSSMRRRLAWLFASGLTAGACAMPPEAEVIGGLPCDPQGACPAGYSCLASKCVQSGSAVEGTGGSSAKEAGTHVDSGTPPGSGGGGTGGSGDGGSGLSGSGGATLDASDRDVSVGTRDAAVDASEASVVDTGTGGVGAGGAGTGGTGAGGIGAGGAGTGGKGTGGVGAGGVGAGGAGTGGTGSGGSPGAGVVCGTMICAAGTHCCFPSSGTPTCSVSTCSSGSTTIACDGPEDCPPGDKCCQSSSGGNQTYGCKTQCGLGDVPIGCSSQNCPAGDVCCEETSGFRTTDTVCSTGCTGLISYTLCMSNADCPGSSCQPATLLVGFRRCN